jgi:hypothetical protein
MFFVYLMILRFLQLTGRLVNKCKSGELWYEAVVAYFELERYPVISIPEENKKRHASG